MHKYIVGIAVLLICGFSQAAIEFGVGTNSVTGGRLVPALHGAVTWSDWALSSTATGVNNNLSYHSSYTLSGYKTWNLSQALGQISSGFGLGLMYGARGFRDTTTSALEEVTDVNFGPAMRIHWSIADSFFLNLESLF